MTQKFEYNREEHLNYLRNCIRDDVAGGFECYENILERAIDMARDEFPEKECESIVKPIIHDEFEKLIQSQGSWPAKTDCDRLDAAFNELNRKGIVARQHFSCCGTCAARDILDEIEEVESEGREVRGYTSYDVQSTEHAVNDGEIALNYGSTTKGEAAALKIAQDVVETLKKHELEPQWDGTWDHRIMVPLDWKRRRDPFAPPFKPKKRFSLTWR